MKLLTICPVHDFSGEGFDGNAYYRDQTNPNDVVRNNIANIKRFNNDVSIIIHVNKDFDKFDPTIADIENVYVNPERFAVTHGSSQMASLLTSIKYGIKLGIEFDYLTVTHSGEMFIKENAIDYMKDYEFSMWYPPNRDKSITGWLPYEMVLKFHREGMDLFNGLVPNHEYAAGFIEGSFYNKALVLKMMNWFEEYFDIQTMNNLDFVLEEIMIPTVAYYLSETKNPATSINAILLTGGHQPQRTMDNIELIRNNKPLQFWNANQFGGEIIDDTQHIYTVKRINRTMNDPIRQQISKL